MANVEVFFCEQTGQTLISQDISMQGYRNTLRGGCHGCLGFQFDCQSLVKV